MTPAAATRPATGRPAVFWVLRAVESALLLAGLVGIGLFAYSLIDIVRIETAPVRTAALPPSAWPGVFLFFGSMVALQAVRIVLHRYRRDDGSFNGDDRGRAAAATADILSSVEDDGERAVSAESYREG